MTDPIPLTADELVRVRATFDGRLADEAQSLIERILAARLDAPTADRDEVAEVLHQSTCEGRLFAHNASVTRCERAADALLARFDIRRKHESGWTRDSVGQRHA